MINFILGGLFLYILLPILESFMSAICSRVEVYKASCGLKIAEYNSKIAQLSMGEEQDVVAHPIGFQYTPEEEDDNDDDEEIL